MNKFIIFICLMLLLTSCNQHVGGDEFFNKINEIERGLEIQNWEKTIDQVRELKEMYNKEKWKIQLLGDEDEYESLYESINKLITAAKMKDLTNAMLELTMIFTLLEDIYSL